MTNKTPRTPEWEDSEQSNTPLEVEDIAERLDIAGIAMHQALRTATHSPMAEAHPCRILAVDDNIIFLEALHTAAARLNLDVTPLAPSHLQEVCEHILAAFEQNHPYDYVLLDFSYKGKDFNGLDILRSLRPEDDTQPLAELEEKDIRLYYLPVAIVTRGGSVVNHDRYFEEKALGAGADKVYAEKGFGAAETAGQQAGLSPQSLLEALLKGGFKEMRFRAWARLWQDMRDQMEEQIKQQLDSNQWMKDETIEKALEAVWVGLAKPIKLAGYATHLSMRILHSIKQPRSANWPHDKNETRKLRWELRKVGSTDETDDCPPNIPWDAMPILQQCLIEERLLVHALDYLSEQQLIAPAYQVDKDMLKFRRYIGCHAMAVRIDAIDSPVGTFLITRESEQPPFFSEDQVHLRIIVERLGLFYRELRMRQRNHDRQLALVRLGRELLDVEDENIIVSKAVRVLYWHLHRSRSAFTENGNDNPAVTGRVSIRLIEPGTGRLMRPDQRQWLDKSSDYMRIPRWAMGFDTNERAPGKITVDSDPRYSELVIRGKPKFFPKPTAAEIDEHRNCLTHAKMLVPIMAGPVVIGAINAEHQRPDFYGEDRDASADFTLLQGIALEVGHALRALRTRRMLRKLLKLHMSTGEEGQDRVIEQLMGILYDYTGCAVGIWIEPSASGWHIGGVWECPQGYNALETAPTKFATTHKIPTWRLRQWQQHIMGNFPQTLFSKLIHNELLIKTENNFNRNWSEDDLVYYCEEGFLANDEMDVKTLSQALLALRDPESKKLLGVFGLLFNQKPGLDLKRQQPLLEEAARFAASYLAVRRENRQYLMNSQIMEQQKALGIAYQQLRHSLKLQFGGLNGALNSLSVELKSGVLNPVKIEAQIAYFKDLLSDISRDMKLSRNLMDLPDLTPLDLKPVWEDVRMQLENIAQHTQVDVFPMEESVWVMADAKIVTMAFTNLIDNAIDVLARKDGLRQIQCVLLPSITSEYSRIAVRDTGPGVDPEIADRLFKEIGISNKPSGSGFGTYFSAFMLERSGAHIEYDPSWQDGAQFIINFPAYKLEARSHDDRRQ